MNYIELETNIIEWAKDRNLVKPENGSKQLLKTMEELGEVSSSYLKNDTDGIKDGIGDVIVTLIIFAEQNNLSLLDCLESAYNEIKNRKGKTINGTFIKNT